MRWECIAENKLPDELQMKITESLFLFSVSVKSIGLIVRCDKSAVQMTYSAMYEMCDDLTLFCFVCGRTEENASSDKESFHLNCETI